MQELVKAEDRAMTAPQGETASQSAAAQLVAATQARYKLAIARPRNLDSVRVALLGECRRPGFAAAATYHKPIGRGVSGPSIRFVEAGLRCLGNVLVETPTVYDDPEKRIVRVQVTDLETNATYSRDITVSKTVERSDPRGAGVISSRTNSQGKTVYTIAATDDDIAQKEAALVSKSIRVLGLRIMPGDLVDECIDACAATVANEGAADPAAARKKMVDGFLAVGVGPEDLVGYIGKSLDRITPQDIVELRSIYSAIRDGSARWEDYASNHAGKDQQPQKELAAETISDLLQAKKRAQAPTPEKGKPNG